MGYPIDKPTEYELTRVYFIVESKYGEAVLHIEHNPACQALHLPVHPSSAVEDALPHLHPETAHYAAQWENIMPDKLHRGTEGFSIPGDQLPNGIAPPENADTLFTIAQQHAGPELTAWYHQPALTGVLHTDVPARTSNYTWQFAHEIETINQHDITPLETPHP